MQKIDEYLNIKKAAIFLGISPSTLRNWEKDGKIAVYRNPLNKYRLYKLDDLKNILESIDKSEEVTKK